MKSLVVLLIFINIIFRYGLTKAIKHWKNLPNLTQNQKIKFLKRDTENGPFHVFGCHKNCNP